jgi:hypothetical protein
LADRPPPEPSSPGQDYRLADEAIEDGSNPVPWLEGARRRVAEALKYRAS